MNTLLVVIPISREDTSRAELLLDLIYQIDGRVTKGNCLLCFAPEVHQEQKDKLKIAAELAFTNVDLHEIRQLVTADGSKGASISAMFYYVAQHISGVYRTPWLWLEPDCMPLKKDWRESLSEAYQNQARRYLCRKMQAGTAIFVARTGIYPPACINDIAMANTARVPFAESIADRAAFTALFQEAAITSVSDIHKIRPDALVLHSDKQGVLADWVRQQNGGTAKVLEEVNKTIQEASEALDPILIPASNGVAPKKRGRPAKKPELAAV